MNVADEVTVIEALFSLRDALDAQFKMQQETNELLRSLIRTLQKSERATEELAAALSIADNLSR